MHPVIHFVFMCALFGKSVPEMTYTVSTVRWDVKPYSFTHSLTPCWPALLKL